MSWFKVDDKMTFHRKVLMAGNAAIGAWVRMGAHTAAQLADGFVSDEEARIIAAKAELDKLVQVGLLEVAGGGYQMHDFLEYNPSSTEVTERREQRRQSGRIGGQRSVATKAAAAEAKTQANGQAHAQAPTQAGAQANGQAHAQAGAQASAQAKINPVPSRPVPSRPVPSRPVPSRPVPSRPEREEDREGEAVSPPARRPRAKDPSAKPLLRIRPDWRPSPGVLEDLREKLRVDPEPCVADLVDWAISKGEKREDWDGTFRGWVRKEAREGKLPAWEPVTLFGPPPKPDMSPEAVAGRAQFAATAQAMERKSLKQLEAEYEANLTAATKVL